MKSHLSVVLLTGLITCSALAQDKPDLSDPNQKYNYAFGMDVISTFKQVKVDIDLNAFTAGMQDALAGKPALTPEEEKAAIASLAKQMAAQAAVQLKFLMAKNL